MNFLFSFLLFFSPFLAFGRVAPPQAGNSAAITTTCDTLLEDGTINPDCKVQLVGASSPADLIATTAHISDTNGTYKTPIPDLSVLGYVWSTYPSYSFLEYNNVLVDQFYIGVAIDTLVVKAAFNKDCDANPLKVPLRDIIASFYVYKSGAPHGRDLGMLEKIVYDNVVETDLKLLMPDICSYMGQDVKKNQRNKSSFQVRPDQIGDERNAYDMISTTTPFGVGAMKIVEEYQALGGRKPTFEFQWMGGSQFNFNVLIPYPGPR